MWVCSMSIFWNDKEDTHSNNPSQYTQVSFTDPEKYSRWWRYSYKFAAAYFAKHLPRYKAKECGMVTYEIVYRQHGQS